MSNPGVVKLSSLILSNREIFQLEDNIGEAIHIHYGANMRLDTTYHEFMLLADHAEDILNKLFRRNGFNSSFFDGTFLSDIGDKLMDIEDIQLEQMKLEDLIIMTKNSVGLPVMKKLKNSRICKALNGDTQELEAYIQENQRGENNIERVISMMNLLKTHEYPYKDKYIILFNNSNVIKDGQHRAACLLSLYGNISVPVLRVHFKNGQYNSPKYPWLTYIFHWNIKRIKKTLKKIIEGYKYEVKDIIERIQYRIKYFIG